MTSFASVFLQHFNQHIFLVIHFQLQKTVLFHLLEHVGKTLEADGALRKIRIGGLNVGFEDGWIDAFEPVVLIMLQLLGECGAPVFLI